MFYFQMEVIFDDRTTVQQRGMSKEYPLAPNEDPHEEWHFYVTDSKCYEHACSKCYFALER